MHSPPFLSSPKRALPIALALGLAGCSMEPAYQRPDAPMPSAYPNGPAYATPGAPRANPGEPAAAELGWRNFLADAQLQQLVALALANNRDLRVATLDIDEARALYRIQRAAQFPAIDASVGLTSQRMSPALRAPGQSAAINSYDASVGLTHFEIDLFGRVRSLSHAAQEQYLATEEARRSVHISLVAEVANTYLTLLADRALLALAQDTLRSQQDAADMIHRGKQAGAMAQLDEHRADTQVQTARVAAEQYTRQIAQDENALAVLIGGPLPAGVSRAAPLDDRALLAEFPAGLPSTLLERRPDIMAAEHRLIAANANIGAARAAFFPRITLTGALGVASASLAGLFSGGVAWLFVPQLTLPIFNAGSNQANLDLATVRRDINVAGYEHTIQDAFREVADNLAARATYEREVKAQEAMIRDLAETKRLADMRFRNGVDDYFGVFDAQRQLFAAQQLLVTYKLAGLTSRVTLYKALGGGWVESAGAAAAQPRTGPAAPMARPAATPPQTTRPAPVARSQTVPPRTVQPPIAQSSTSQPQTAQAAPVAQSQTIPLRTVQPPIAQSSTSQPQTTQAAPITQARTTPLRTAQPPAARQQAPQSAPAAQPEAAPPQTAQPPIFQP
ncbi:efflux transporter outer membrane subunit [Burkholderia pseudomallei]|uniref:efflux transporter outer membrane subunit n=1 Tax=Burkholderia pseudomallei TaxID=28450 RepID=UPI000536E483|nr:efflux transporter outer membrane subunit [Burkholderia pseudomallei]KGX61529.1 outer membrane protein oprM [Burkholderia pseudomallei TSV44]